MGVGILSKRNHTKEPTIKRKTIELWLEPPRLLIGVNIKISDLS